MRNFFIKYFPYLGVYKRFFVALVYAIQPTKKTYSQHNEDEYFFEILSNYNLDKVNDIILSNIDYIKYGKWVKELGGLENINTNQIFLDVKNNKILNNYFIK